MNALSFALYLSLVFTASGSTAHMPRMVFHMLNARPMESTELFLKENLGLGLVSKESMLWDRAEPDSIDTALMYFSPYARNAQGERTGDTIHIVITLNPIDGVGMLMEKFQNETNDSFQKALVTYDAYYFGWAIGMYAMKDNETARFLSFDELAFDPCEELRIVVEQAGLEFSDDKCESLSSTDALMRMYPPYRYANTLTIQQMKDIENFGTLMSERFAVPYSDLYSDAKDVVRIHQK